MKFKPGITVHCVVKNEERFVWYAINSVLPYVDRVLVSDTGSTDRTVDVIAAIQSDKIMFEEKGAVSKEVFPQVRQEQIDRTDTEWMLVLDGDEIWPERTIREFVECTRKAPNNITMIAGRYYNFIDNIMTSLEDFRSGAFNIKGEAGFINLRGIRMTLPGLHARGDYGIEGYYDEKDELVQKRVDEIHIIENKYYHTTYLPRSSSLRKDWEIPYRRGKLFRLGKRRRLREMEPEIRQLFSHPVPIIGYAPLKDQKRVRNFFKNMVLNLVIPAIKALRDGSGIWKKISDRWFGHDARE